MAFIFKKTAIEGVFEIEPKVFGDSRGYFMETYNEDDFKREGLDYHFVQDNQSRSHQGVLRGLVEMDSTLKTTVTGKMTVVSGSDDKGSALVSYPIEIEAKSNVTNTDVLKQYDEINNKCTINSAKLSEVEISKFFEYEPKFNLNPSIRSLIEKYKEVK